MLAPAVEISDVMAPEWEGSGKEALGVLVITVFKKQEKEEKWAKDTKS